MATPRSIRRRIARRLGFLADRLAPEDAFRRTCISFEFVTGKGIVTNTEGRGCPLWYQGRADYDRAHEWQTAADQAESERLDDFMRGLVPVHEPPASGGLAAAVQFNFQVRS